jgi:hypothetical protein
MSVVDEAGLYRHVLILRGISEGYQVPSYPSITGTWRPDKSFGIIGG